MSVVPDRTATQYVCPGNRNPHGTNFVQIPFGCQGAHPLFGGYQIHIGTWGLNKRKLGCCLSGSCINFPVHVILVFIDPALSLKTLQVVYCQMLVTQLSLKACCFKTMF